PSPGGCPVVNGVTAWIDCVIYQTVPTGDHVLVLGRAGQFGLEEEAPPLLFLRGGHPQLAGNDPGNAARIREENQSRSTVWSVIKPPSACFSWRLSRAAGWSSCLRYSRLRSAPAGPGSATSCAWRDRPKHGRQVTRTSSSPRVTAR